MGSSHPHAYLLAPYHKANLSFAPLLLPLSAIRSQPCGAGAVLPNLCRSGGGTAPLPVRPPTVLLISAATVDRHPSHSPSSTAPACCPQCKLQRPASTHPVPSLHRDSLLPLAFSQPPQSTPSGNLLGSPFHPGFRHCLLPLSKPLGCLQVLPSSWVLQTPSLPIERHGDGRASYANTTRSYCVPRHSWLLTLTVGCRSLH